MDEVIGIVLVHFYFFKDDAALLRDIAGIENRMKNEVGEHIEGEGKVLIEHFDIEADTFLRREGIHIAADGIDLAGNGLGGAVSVPLNTMCSMKWEMPFHSESSSREPDLSQMPIATERMWGICSVITVRPFGKLDDEYCGSLLPLVSCHHVSLDL